MLLPAVYPDPAVARPSVPDRPRVLQAVGQVGEFLISGATYFGLTASWHLLPAINPIATPLWPPTGFALAFVLLRGYRILPALLVGYFAFQFTAGALRIDLAVAGIATITAAAVGGWLIHRRSNGSGTFATPVAIAKFTTISVVPTAMLSSGIAVGALSAGHGDATFDVANWARWWLTDTAGIFLITPVVVLWATTTRPLFASRRLLETLLIIAAATAIGGFAFGPPIGNELLRQLDDLNIREMFGLSILLPLLWSGLRGNRRDVATASFIFCCMALWGYASGSAIFAKREPDESLLVLFVLAVSTTIPSLILAAMASFHRYTEAQLRSTQDQLKRHVEETTSALFTAKRHFQILLEGVEDHAIFALDVAGKVVNWNSAAQKILGYTAQEMINCHFETFYRPEDRRVGEPSRALLAAKEKGKHQVEGWRIRKNRSLFFIAGSVSSIRDSTGSLVGFVSVLRDLTERRDAEEKLIEAREQLAMAQKMEAIGKLTGGIAHDFNNLLMIIGGNAQIFQRLLDPKLPRAIEAIRTAAKRGETLTRQLLTFSRRQHLSPTVIDLAVCIKNLHPIIESSLRGNIVYNEDIPAGAWPVEVDLAELELAIVNIAVNARDAMPNGGTFTISISDAPDDDEIVDARADSPLIAIKCSDTGMGIAPDILSKIFDPYFTTKEVGKGTGLGLSQVHGFAYQARGRVTVQSATGEGATITIYLPWADKELSLSAVDHQPSQHPTVLIVDDSAEVAEVTSSLFGDLGYSSIYENSADAALKVLAGGTKVDLVFSDIVMPGSMDGIGLATEIRSRYPGLPVILATGYSDAAQAVPSNLKILRKPFDHDALKSFIQEFARLN